MRAICTGAAAVALCATLAPTCTAWADELTVTGIGNVDQFEIESLETAYKNAATQVLEANARIAENQAKIDSIEKDLPAQQERTNKAVRGLYLLDQDNLYYLDILLGTQSFDDFINEVEYFERTTRTNVAELNKLKGMLDELAEARTTLENDRALADEQAEKAREALIALQDHRAEIQKKGQTEALAEDKEATDLVDGADWHMSEAEFVATWAPRIDAYFEGTPMAGTGQTFALMSFRYCVDPRWSPAISNTESSKGNFCIRPHNAWGWGAADSDPYNLASEWKSWDEAIEAHIRGLATGYGYTISKKAAEKYCSSPDSWYENTLKEMAKI